MKRNLSFYAIVFIFSMLVMRFSGLLSKLVLARLITPYEYGLITLIVLSLPGFLQIFTNFFLFEVVSHSKEGRKYFGFSIVYALISISFVMLFLYFFHEQVFAFLNLKTDSWFLYWVIILVVIIPVTLLGNFMGLFRGLRQYSMASFISMAPSVLRLLLVLMGVYMLSVSDFKEVMIIFAIPSLVVLCAILIYKFRSIMRLLKRSLVLPPKEMLFFGLSVYLVGIFGNFMQQFNKLVVSHDLGVEYQGYFDVSLTIIGILAFSFSTMQFVTIPEATNNKDNRNLLYKKGDLGDIARGLFAFMVFCVIIISLYSGEIVELLFSKDYLVASSYVYILAIGYIFLFLQQFLAYLNISTSNNLREYRSFFFVSVLMLMTLPFITHLMIVYLGFIGAYLSTTLFLILYCLVTLYFTKDLTPLQTILHRGERLLLSSFLTLFFLFYFMPDFLTGLVMSSIFYVLLVFSLGYLHKDLITSVFSRKDEMV